MNWIPRLLKTEEDMAKLWSALVMTQVIYTEEPEDTVFFWYYITWQGRKNFVKPRKTLIPTISKTNNLKIYPYFHANIELINFYSCLKTVNLLGVMIHCSVPQNTGENTPISLGSYPKSAKDFTSDVVIPTTPIFPF